MDRRVTQPKRVTSPNWGSHLHVNRPLLCFCCSNAFLASHRGVFVPRDTSHRSPLSERLEQANLVTDQVQKVYWLYHKNGLDCGHIASLEWDIRDVAYKNTALYSRIFHERGICDVRSDWVLWEQDIHQNPQLSTIVILFQGGYNPIKVRGVKTPLEGTRILLYERVPNSFPPVRGSNSTTTYITGTANFNSNKDKFRTLY